jgi:energy-coupling factor transport system ATP-binding protein
MGINFQRVNFKYSYKAPLTLKEVNLEISEKNEFICILGHTGSGKSTLVQNMNALLLPTSGQITVFNKNVIKVIKHPYKLNTKKNRLKYNFIDNNKLFARGNKVIYSSHLKDLRKHIGLVFQFPEYQLFESTVLKDVMFGPKNFGLSDEEARHEAKKACTIVGLPKDVLEKSPFSLSGGQMRRVAIAGIIALNPDVIVLDEPTVGLDPKGKEELMNLLVSIQKETSKTIIMITHDMNVVGKYAKRVIVMDKGVKVFDGNKRDLFENIERLHNFNLDLPTSANLAVKLKEKGLINYTHLPLSKEELETVILGGDINE